MKIGKAADIKGYVTDNKGNTITTFESYHFGMGKFLFTPQAGQMYKCRYHFTCKYCTAIRSAS